MFSERGWRRGGEESTGKALPPKAAGEKEKEWKHRQGSEQKRRKEKGEGFSTIRGKIKNLGRKSDSVPLWFPRNSEKPSHESRLGLETPAGTVHSAT